MRSQCVHMTNPVCTFLCSVHMCVSMSVCISHLVHVASEVAFTQSLASMSDVHGALAVLDES